MIWPVLGSRGCRRVVRDVVAVTSSGLTVRAVGRRGGHLRMVERGDLGAASSRGYWLLPEFHSSGCGL